MEKGNGDTIINEYNTNYITNNYYLYGGVIIATIVTVNPTNFACSMSEEAENVTVTPLMHLGSNALTGDVWPKLVATDTMPVFRSGVNYYTTFPFGDSEVWS